VTAVKPGVSVDYTFSVWKIRVEDASKAIVLGPLGLDDPRHPAQVPVSMYGVASVGIPEGAVPITRHEMGFLDLRAPRP
jgi:hypothetical protein